MIRAFFARGIMRVRVIDAYADNCLVGCDSRVIDANYKYRVRGRINCFYPHRYSRYS